MNGSSLCEIATDFKFKLLIHNRGKSTARIVTIPGVPPAYLFITRDGNIGVFNAKLQLLRTYTCRFHDYKERVNDGKPVPKPWVNDAVHMPDCQKLAIVTTHQTLHLYDISATIYLEEYRVYGFPTDLTCLNYAGQTDEELPSILVIGAENGAAFIFHFSQPTNLLFKKQDQHEVEKLHFSTIDDHFQYATLTILANLHSSSIRRIQLNIARTSIITCSYDSDSSLRFFDINNKLKNYTFDVKKGITCFDFNHDHQILVTASPDHIVRFWNPYVPRYPTAILKGHCVTILDVALKCKLNVVFSFSKDGMLIVWSIAESVSLQVLKLNFPAFFVLGHTPEYNNSPLHLDTEKHRLFVTCSDWVTELAINRKKVEKLPDATFSKYTHESFGKESPNIFESSEESESTDTLHASDICTLSTQEELHALLQRHPQPKPDNLDVANIENVTSRDSKKTPIDSRAEFQEKLFKKMGLLEGHVSHQRMLHFVRDGGPHWSLKTHCLTDITFPPLPMSQRMRENHFECRTESELLNFNFNFLTLQVPDGASCKLHGLVQSAAPGETRVNPRMLGSLKASLAFLKQSSASKTIDKA